MSPEAERGAEDWLDAARERAKVALSAYTAATADDLIDALMDAGVALVPGTDGHPAALASVSAPRGLTEGQQLHLAELRKSFPRLDATAACSWDRFAVDSLLAMVDTLLSALPDSERPDKIAGEAPTRKDGAATTALSQPPPPPDPEWPEHIASMEREAVDHLRAQRDHYRLSLREIADTSEDEATVRFAMRSLER